ncbi:MAG: DUF2791 family P-loop domain-containing protein, partial [Caldilineaceae bacterium]|nr:DUF2791 family P-loop domain-containing protein [Caldilineaceae bacterium]
MSKLPQLSVSLFGGFRLLVDEQPHTAISQPQQQSLLAYLMLHTRTPQLRRQVAFCFWPDLNEVRAHANLRRALHKLRSDCPAVDHFLVSTATTLSWRRPATFTLDVLVYEMLIAQAEQETDRAHAIALFRQAAAAYQDDLLPGCYEEWLLTERVRLKQLQLHLLHHLTVLLAEAGDDAVAIHYAGELCRCDPLREQSYRLLMSCHAACGDRAAALRAYHDCVAVLDSELGVEPEPETQAIYQRLLNHGTIAAVAAPLTARSVALDHILVGRTAEWQQLLASWQQAGAGASRLVLIQGDAGIGKTHLAEALLTWARQRGQLTVHTRAYAAEGQLSYSPVVEWLRSPPYANLATELADVWLTECSRLLPELLTTRPQLAASPPLNDSGQRRRLFEALARAALLPRQPLLVLIDDLQWADQETVEWLHFLLRFDPTAPRLVVGTVRQSEISANHPLANLQQELHRVGWIQEIILTPLTPEASAELAQKTAGSALSKATLANLHHYA